MIEVDDVVVLWLTGRSTGHDARFQRSSVLYGRRSQSRVLCRLPRAGSSKIARQSARCAAGRAARRAATRSNDARAWFDPGRPASLRTCARGGRNVQHGKTRWASTFIDRSYPWRALHLADEICEQRRGIVPSPHERQRQRHVQIDHG